MASLSRDGLILTEIKIPVISLSENHPLHEEVFPWIEGALNGPNTLPVLDYYPLRTQYIMTRHFGVLTIEARNAVQSLHGALVRAISATTAIVHKAYQISTKTHESTTRF